VSIVIIYIIQNYIRIYIKKYTLDNTSVVYIMKILSFDVGIKNLAYCLFSINCCNDNILKILKWDVINLCDTVVSKKYKCSLCKKNAHYYLNATADEEEDTINSTVYCKKHAIQTKLVMYDSCDKSKSKCRVKSKSKEKESSYPHLKIIVPPIEQNACDVDMIVLGKKLKNKFDLIFSEYNHVPHENGTTHSGIDAVVIENQIGPLAGRMKMLQGMIAQYFIMMNVNKIEFISATNKLKLFKNVGNENVGNENVGNENVGNENSYKMRKQKGQHICKSLVTFYPSMKSWNQEFDKHLKKDDLADCFLQGYYYMYSSSVYKKMFAFDLDLFIKGACCETQCLVSLLTPSP